MIPADGGWALGFLASLIVVLAASDRLVVAVEAAGDHYRWPPGLVGLLAAAGADGPEVSSSLIALFAGARDVSLGVIVGSNLFNLAALLGVPVALVGSVAVQRYGLLVNGTVMALATLLAALLVLGALPVLPAGVLVVALLAGYAALLILPREVVLRHLPPLQVRRDESGDSEAEERAREREADITAGFPSGRHLLLQGLLATAVIIAGCGVLVNATLYLGPRLGLSQALTGTFGLAALTSLPNVWVAISLARRQRGAVLVSAVCNSNTINAIFGICVPAHFVALHPARIVRDLDLPALGLLTLLTLLLVWRGRGLTRPGGLTLVLAYLAFAAVRLALTPVG